jgi:hypothetical protein
MIIMVYSPKKIIIAEGQIKSVTLRPGVNEIPENNSAIPENFGTIYFFFNYTGSGTVDSTHRLNLGIGQNATMTATFMGISLQANGEKIYAIVPAGTWYAGGFFDADGDAISGDEMPDTGDPTELYDNVVYNGSNLGTPITVVAGEYTAMVDFELDDSILY